MERGSRRSSASGGIRRLAVLVVGAWLVVAGGATAQDGDAVLQGVVFDSTAMKVLSGARVAIIGTNALAETDGQGRFRLTQLPAGTHWISFYHERLQELGVSAPSRQVTFGGGETRSIELAVPSEETLLLGWCLAEQPRPGYGVLAGTVTDEITGVRMPGATVEVRPIAQGAGMPTPLEARTNDEGYFRICSLPADVEFRVQASFRQSSGRSVDITVAPGRAEIQDLVLLMSAVGTLAGVVRDYVTGDPIAGARVEVLGTSSATLTDLTGRFSLDDLPQGRHRVTTDHPAFEERIDSVTVFSQETVDIEVRMATEALEVEGLVVTARTRFGESRSPAGTAKRLDFITRDEIEAMLPRVSTATDILRNMNTPGLRIREVYVQDPLTEIMVPGYCIEVTRPSVEAGCTPAAVALNDALVPYPDQVIRDLDPNIIERIEVLSPVDAMFQFGTRAGNGAIAIHTR